MNNQNNCVYSYTQPDGAFNMQAIPFICPERFENPGRKYLGMADIRCTRKSDNSSFMELMKDFIFL